MLKRDKMEVTTESVMAELEASAPYRYYYDLEVRIRDIFRSHAGDLPAHYGYRDFLTWAFDKGRIVRTRKGFETRSVAAAKPREQWVWKLVRA